MKQVVAGMLGLILLSGQGKAHADQIVATFSGQVYGVSGPANSFTNGIYPGSTITATITYDTNASPLATNGINFAAYNFLSSPR